MNIGEGHDECRNAQAGDGQTLIKTDDQTDDHDDENGKPFVDAVGLHENGCESAGKAGDVTDRKIDVLENEDQRHADGKHADISCLVKQIGDIGGSEELSAGPDLKYKHDNDQSNVHHVALDVVF